MQYYTNAVLTVIAICLIALTYSDYYGTKNVQVSKGRVRIHGKVSINDPVKVTGRVSIDAPVAVRGGGNTDDKSVIVRPPN